jgi:hypothetical protein
MQCIAYSFGQKFHIYISGNVFLVQIMLNVIASSRNTVFSRGHPNTSQNSVNSFSLTAARKSVFLVLVKVYRRAIISENTVPYRQFKYFHFFAKNKSSTTDC